MVVVQAAEPAQVIVQLDGDAVKAPEPLLEAAVIGIDVLDIYGAPDAHVRAQVDGLV